MRASPDNVQIVAPGLDHPEGLNFGPDGLLYAGTEDHGVYRLDPQQGGFWQAMRGRDGGLSNGGMRVREMVFDALGNHYLATNGGIFRRLAGRTFWQHLDYWSLINY